MSENEKLTDLQNQSTLISSIYITDLISNAGILCQLKECQIIFFKCLRLAPIFFLLLTQFSACFAESEYKKIPVSKKIDISQPDVKTELLVHISSEDNYAFSLDFKCKNKEDKVRVSSLLWGKDAYGRETNGEKTPISIDVYTQKNGETHLVSTGGSESMKTYAMSGGYGKLIYTDYLMPGDYWIAIDSKAGNPKFKDVDVEVNIGLAHKPK